MAKIRVMGAGGWGTALAMMADRSGHQVSMWSVFEEEVERLSKVREHKKLLPGVKIPDSIEITGDLASTAQADLVILAVPSFAVRDTARLLKGVLPKGTVVVNVAKGFEEEHLLRLSQVIEEELPEARVAVLSGPSHAEEVSRGVPTTVVVASRSKEAACYVQDTLMNSAFRVYVNPDLTGVELGGALKNIIALAAGVCDGLGLGDNTKAALMTRGLTEIARLGVKMGAKQETFAGLTGIGDLVVTCTSMHSRNRRAGILIGEGIEPKEAVRQVGMVEGDLATHSAYRLSEKYGVEMPITAECYQVLFHGKDPKLAITDLMERPKRSEAETTWLDFHRQD